MSPEKWREMSKIFNAAVEMNSAERLEYLNRACGSDQEFRGEIEKLLDAADDDERDSFIDSSKAGVASPGAAIAAAPRFAQGEKIGAFQIVKILGAGGMGEVFLARDLRLNRQVALKFLS